MILCDNTSSNNTGMTEIRDELTHLVPRPL